MLVGWPACSLLLLWLPPLPARQAACHLRPWEPSREGAHERFVLIRKRGVNDVLNGCIKLLWEAQDMWDVHAQVDFTVARTYSCPLCCSQATYLDKTHALISRGHRGMHPQPATLELDDRHAHRRVPVAQVIASRHGWPHSSPLHDVLNQDPHAEGLQCLGLLKNPDGVAFNLHEVKQW